MADPNSQPSNPPLRAFASDYESYHPTNEPGCVGDPFPSQSTLSNSSYATTESWAGPQMPPQPLSTMNGKYDEEFDFPNPWIPSCNEVAGLSIACETRLREVRAEMERATDAAIRLTHSAIVSESSYDQQSHGSPKTQGPFGDSSDGVNEQFSWSQPVANGPIKRARNDKANKKRTLYANLQKRTRNGNGQKRNSSSTVESEMGPPTPTIDATVHYDEAVIYLPLGEGKDCNDAEDNMHQDIPEVSNQLDLSTDISTPVNIGGASPAPQLKYQCWVCHGLRFPSIKDRKAHYEDEHPNSILKCLVKGCKSNSFLREEDRTKHVTKFHQKVLLQHIHTETGSAEADSCPSGLKEEDVSSPSNLPVGLVPSARSISHEPGGTTGSFFGSSELQGSTSTCSQDTVGFATDSTWSEEESDWEDDEIDPRELLIQTIENSQVSVRPLLSPMKKELVEGIMKEFWVIFNQEWSANMRQCSGESSMSMTSSVSQQNIDSGDSSNKNARKRKREGEKDENREDDDGGNPKRPKIVSSPPSDAEDKIKFACPYRKHDPRTYCHQNRCWRSCALTPLDTIARVKGHLYRYHRIFQCPRCKVLEKSANDLEERHTLAVKACELNLIQPAEGITGNIEKKLRSRKKTHKGQSETERWQEMYRILFPNEGVPSPYFEAIQDDVIRSPGAEKLTSYEEYSRRELPRFFQSALEAVIADETQPIEERLRRQLVGMIQDCQDRVFSTFKARRMTDASTPALAEERSQSSLLTGQENIKPQAKNCTGIIETLYARPPRSTSLPRVETAIPEMTSKVLTENGSSDSGYISEPPILGSNLSSNYGTLASETVTASSSQNQDAQKVMHQDVENKVMYTPFSMQDFSMQQMYGYDLQEMSSSQSDMDQPVSYDDGQDGFDPEKWMTLNGVQTEGEDIWREGGGF